MVRVYSFDPCHTGLTAETKRLVGGSAARSCLASGQSGSLNYGASMPALRLLRLLLPGRLLRTAN